jgi:ABC-type amino acid transport substrate-binding protein
LKGQAIAIVRGSTQEDALRKYLPGSLSTLVNHYEEGINLLEAGEVAAVLADKVRLLSTVKLSDKFQLFGDILVPQKYAVGVAKGNPQLLDVVNCAVREFRESNDFDQSFEDYLSALAADKPDMSNTRRYVDVSTSSDIERERGKIGVNLYANEDASSWLGKIRKRGYLIAAVRSNIPGMGFKNPRNGEYEGLEINLVRQIAAIIFGDPSKVQFKSVRSRQRINSLKSPLQAFDPLLRSISVLSSVFNSNWWNLGMAGKLPSFLCPSDCVGQLDYVGLDYYWGSKSLLPGPVLKLIKASQGVYSKAPVWSQGLYSLLKQHARLFPGMEIIVVENGCVDQASNIKREEYIEEHVQQLVRAHQDGVPIKAYVCWSITSNREWGLRFGADSDFGLFHIDLDTDPSLKRYPTSASNAYKNIINRHASI